MERSAPTTAEMEKVLRSSLALPAMLFWALAALTLLQIAWLFSTEKHIVQLDQSLNACAQAQTACWGATPEELPGQLAPRLQALRESPVQPELLQELDRQPARPDQLIQVLQGIRLELQAQRQQRSAELQRGLLSLVLWGVFAGLAPLVAVLLWQRRRLGQVVQTYGHLNGRLRQLAQNLQDAQESERRRLARELHDDLGQIFTSQKMDLDWLQRQEGLSPETRARLEEMRALNGTAVTSVRRIVNELRPAILDDLGLAAAVEWLSEDLSARGQLQLVRHWPEKPLPPALESALFRLVQEGLHNVVKHAGARRVWVQLRLTRRRVYLRVADDGQGVSAGPGQGRSGAQERAEILGGWAGYRARKRGGAVLLAVLPCAT